MHFISLTFLEDCLVASISSILHWVAAFPNVWLEIKLIQNIFPRNLKYFKNSFLMKLEFTWIERILNLLFAHPHVILFSENISYLWAWILPLIQFILREATPKTSSYGSIFGFSSNLKYGLQKSTLDLMMRSLDYFCQIFRRQMMFIDKTLPKNFIFILLELRFDSRFPIGTTINNYLSQWWESFWLRIVIRFLIT